MYTLTFTDIGEGLHEAEILQWFVQVGDDVKIDQPIVEVQTDKAAVEITSPKEGMIRKRNGAEGDTIEVGDTIVEMELQDQPTKTTSQIATSNIESLPNKTAVQQQKYPNLKSSPNEKRIVATPGVRKYARDRGIDLKNVRGSAKNGRIVKQDVIDFFQEKETSSPIRDDQIPSEKRPIRNHVAPIEANEVLPIRGLRKKIYHNMVKSASIIPHVTGMDEINVDRLVKLRQEINQTASSKITYLPIIVKLVVEVLRENPIFNASIDEEKEEIILKKQYNIGIAMATKQGLIVPIIHHADQKSIEEIAIEINQLNEKAEKGTLSLSELQGGTFTISSTGAKGGFYATPIINHPEVAILGIHSINEKPVILPNREIGIGKIMGMSLSFDHRIIDGEPAGIFMNDLKNYMENPESWLLKAR